MNEVRATGTVAAVLDGSAYRKLEQMQPRCPTCKGSLVYRPSHRRFIEDDYYVQCAQGHTWKLGEPETEDPSQEVSA